MSRPYVVLLRAACCVFFGLATVHCGALNADGTPTDTDPAGGSGNGPLTGDSNALGGNGNLAVAVGGNGNGTPTAANGNGAAGGGNGAMATNGNAVAMGKGVVRLPMTGCCRYDYFATLSVGKSDLSLLLDTGSTMMAVAASTCATCASAAKYDISSGTSSQTTTSSTYADGSGWQGTIYGDNVGFGPTASLVSAKAATKFAVITQASDFFSGGSCGATGDVKFDGILGLGPDALLRRGTTSLWTGVAATKTLAADVFSFRHCSVGGDMWLGGYDPSVPSAAPTYTPMVATGSAAAYYSMNVTSISLAGTNIGTASANIGPMVVDNGTSALLLSDAAYAALTARITSNSAFLANFRSTFFTDGACAQLASTMTPAQLDAALPKVTFTLPKVGGGTFNVELSAMASYLLPLRVNNRIVYCPILAVHPEGVPPLYGNAAMQQHVVIFDRGGARIGFAPHNTCTSPVAILD